jgi:hypothetical protein
MMLWKRKAKPKYKYYPADFIILGDTILWEVFSKGVVMAQGKTNKGLKAAVSDANKSISPAQIIIRKIETI